MLSSAEKKSAEILGKTIESAEVHYTFCDVEFRRTIGLNTKFRWKKIFSADVRCIICVVEFRRKTKKTIVRKKNCRRSRGRGLQKFRRFFLSRSQVHNLCSGVPPTDKVRKKNKCNRSRGTGPQKFRRKKKNQQISGRLMPHNRPQRKKGPQSL